MSFIKIPVPLAVFELTPRELSIFFHLNFLWFKYCGTGRQTTFFISDRALAKFCKCSTKYIFEAKRQLLDRGLISFSIGEGNVTHYTILFSPLKK